MAEVTPLVLPSKTIASQYGTSNQAITCTFTTPATGAKQCSAAVDNSTNLFVDALVQATVTAAGSGISTSGFVDVYAYGTANSGTTYTAAATGTNAPFTGSLFPLFRLGRIDLTTASQVNVGGPWSVAAAFGGSMPDHWGIVIDNECGAALAAGSAWYQGVLGQYT
jgi:hypothetical protein